MSQINYKEFKTYLKNIQKNPFAPVYLIYGEELLCKTVFEKLLKVLIPKSECGFNYEPFDGSSVDISEVIQRVNTFSLLSNAKITAIQDARVFDSKQDQSAIFEKTKQVYNNQNIAQAAKHFTRLLGILNLSFEDIDKTNRSKVLNIDSYQPNDDDWLDALCEYCANNNLSIKSSAKSDDKALQNAIEKGFPKGNHLIITSDSADKRRTLFKAINEYGMIIDCTVPKGERKADKIVQEAVLREKVKAILGRSKTMDNDAYFAVCEMTGFDLRTFSNNIEKLVIYIGDRKNITIDDVKFVLKRTKKDPIYEFTNAISDKNTASALFFLKSLLNNEIYPLQILAAMTNQIRKLMLVRSFLESSSGKMWRPNTQYNYFRSSIMPAICEYDQRLLNKLQQWDAIISENNNANNKTTKSKKKKGYSADLLIAKNPKNPYPVYQMLKKADKFTMSELFEAVKYLSKADLELKSTNQNPKLVLEKVIFDITN